MVKAVASCWLTLRKCLLDFGCFGLLWCERFGISGFVGFGGVVQILVVFGCCVPTPGFWWLVFRVLGGFCWVVLVFGFDVVFGFELCCYGWFWVSWWWRCGRGSSDFGL